jgi:hypothetical protein
MPNLPYLLRFTVRTAASWQVRQAEQGCPCCCTRWRDHRVVQVGAGTYVRNAPVHVAFGDPLGPARQCPATRVRSSNRVVASSQLRHCAMVTRRGSRAGGPTEHANPCYLIDPDDQSWDQPPRGWRHTAPAAAREWQSRLRGRRACLAAAHQLVYLQKPSVLPVGT